MDSSPGLCKEKSVFWGQAFPEKVGLWLCLADTLLGPPGQCWGRWQSGDDTAPTLGKPKSSDLWEIWGERTLGASAAGPGGWGKTSECHGQQAVVTCAARQAGFGSSSALGGLWATSRTLRSSFVVHNMERKTPVLWDCWGNLRGDETHFHILRSGEVILVYIRFNSNFMLTKTACHTHCMSVLIMKEKGTLTRSKECLC